MPVELRQLYPQRVFSFGDSEPSLTATANSTGSALAVQNANDTASNQVAIFRGANRSTAADGDEGYITYTLEDSGGDQSEFARMTWKANDVTSNTKDSRVVWAVQAGNTLTDVWEISSSTSGAVTTSFQTGEIVLPDNVSIQLGTSGADADLSSDGTDIKWIVPATADVILGRTGAPSPDTLLHLWTASSGSVNAVSGTILAVESDGNAFLNFLSPTASGFYFGDAAANNIGSLIYTHSSNTLNATIAGTNQVNWTDGAIAFQRSMTLSSTAAFTLTSPILTTPQINDSATDHQYVFVVGNLAADRTITLPVLTGNDTFVFEAHTQTLTNKTFTNPVLNGTLSGTAFLDEDTMSSDSAIAVASQQSIKAYVSAQITAEDLDVTTDSGTIAIDLDSEVLTIAGGTGLDSSATGNIVTLAIDSTVATLTGTQTLTNKTLTSPIVTTPQINDSAADHQYVFAVGNLAADRTVTLPVLTGSDTFVFEAHTQALTNKTIVAGSNTISGIVNANLSGSAAISNANLANSAITIGGTSTSLGGTITALTALTDLDLTAGNKTIFDTVGANTLTIGAGTTTVTIAGNLTVSGTTTTVASNIVTIGDALIILNNDESGTPSHDSGHIIERGSSTNVGFIWDESADEWAAINTDSTGTETGNVTISSYAGLQVGGFSASSMSLGGVDVVTLTGSQTLTNKTLTAPTINAGTLNLMTVLTVANDIDVGAYEIRALKFESDQATGTAPLTVASTTVVTNLNADLLDGVQGALYSQIVGTETLTNKTLTAPKIVSGGFIADANGAEQIIFTTTASAVNELTLTNGATGVPATIASSGESNIGLRISGSGTGGVILHGGATKGSYLEFGVKQTTVPDDPGTELARMYLKEIDSNNNALAVKIQKAGSIVEVEITSPKAICAVCGSKDGALDPTYDFSRSIMVIELWCGHSFEVPMQWSQINGN